MTELPEQEWRVEAELDDEAVERLRAHDLGSGVIVTRDGTRFYAYTTSEAAARRAERVLSELAEGGRARTSVWDEERDAWLDAEHGDVVEDPRADQEGPEYFVLVESDDQRALEALAERLRAEDRPVELRRHKLLVGSFDDEEVEQLAERLRGEGRVQVRADIHDLPSPGFAFFETHRPGG
jgi:hypothetical protein